MTEVGYKIHDKLLTDFAALTFSGGATIFSNVKKYFAADTMGARDCLVIPDTTPESVEAPSAGNTQTTRMYTFRAITFEEIEATENDTNGNIKYQRLLNIQDALLDYLQKEPSNLNSWGSSNSIFIWKIRVNTPRFDRQRTTNGFVELLDLSFTVFVNVIPQNL